LPRIFNCEKEWSGGLEILRLSERVGIARQVHVQESGQASGRVAGMKKPFPSAQSREVKLFQSFAVISRVSRPTARSTVSVVWTDRKNNEKGLNKCNRLITTTILPQTPSGGV
jgi:hypothetical protein